MSSAFGMCKGHGAGEERAVCIPMASDYHLSNSLLQILLRRADGTGGDTLPNRKSLEVPVQVRKTAQHWDEERILGGFGRHIGGVVLP